MACVMVVCASCGWRRSWVCSVMTNHSLTQPATGLAWERLLLVPYCRQSFDFPAGFISLMLPRPRSKLNKEDVQLAKGWDSLLVANSVYVKGGGGLDGQGASAC